MKVLGIITEYNPFHQGHQLHIEQSLKKSQADACICIMSGAFLQRGEPAIVNQWARTEMALNAGVDLVIQLPVSYSVRSAEYFAFGAIKLLEESKIVDYLCFGSELGEIEPLSKIAALIVDEPKQVSRKIKTGLAQGISYPQARSQALIEYIKANQEEFQAPTEKYIKILNNPNNILGIEYIKALIQLKSAIIPLTIKREGSGYHSQQLKEFASASAIRNDLENSYKNNTELIDQRLKKALPQKSSEILYREFNQKRGPIFYEDFSNSILTLLRRTNTYDLENFEDIIGGLENRIKDASIEARSLKELINLINTKCFTQTRIQRILTQILLDLDQRTLKKFDSSGGPQYLRVLGFNHKGRELLKLIKNKSSLPLITKVANHYRSNQETKSSLQEMLSFDIKANNIYALAYPDQNFRRGNMDFRKQPIIIK
jgi:predicted nucleotidyltransferase